MTGSLYKKAKSALADGANGPSVTQPLIDALQVVPVLARQHPELLPVPVNSNLS